jgi:hypothetical protein
VRCTIFDPSRSLGVEDAGTGASAFIAALGLALGQAPDSVTQFDFLNPKRPTVQRDVRKLAAVTAAVGLVVVLTGVFASAGLYRYSATSRVDSLKDELNKLTTENRKVTALAKRAETLDGWLRGGRDWLDQWAYLSAVFPSCKDVYVTSMKTNPPDVTGSPSVNFAIKAKSNEAINDLNKRLTDAGYEFKAGQITTGTDPYGYIYTTNIKVTVKPNMAVDLASVNFVPRPEDDVAAAQFGRPGGAARAEGAAAKTVSQTAPAPAAHPPQPAEGASFQERYKAWQAKYEQWLKDTPRPPDSQAQAVEAWRAKREEIRSQMPKQEAKPPAPAPPQPPQPSSGGWQGKRRS